MDGPKVSRWIIPVSDTRKVEIDHIDHSHLMKLSTAGTMQWACNKLALREGLNKLIEEGFINATMMSSNDHVAEVSLTMRGRKLAIIMALQPEKGVIEVVC